MIRLKVKELAEARGWSQNYLSHLAILDIKVIRRMYQQPTASFTTYSLDKVATAFGVDVTDLLESVPDEPRRK